MSVPAITPQLSHAGFAIDPLGLGTPLAAGAFKDASATRSSHGSCLRDYCAFLNKRLISVARDAAVAPESGSKESRAFIHSSVVCSAGAGDCEDALLGVANLRGVLLNQGVSCTRLQNTDAAHADMWRLDLTSGKLLPPPLLAQALTLAAGGLMELLGRQNSPSCTFVIGSAGSGKTQLLLALARQCTDSAWADSMPVVPLFLKPGLLSEATVVAESPPRVVETLLKSAVNVIAGANGMSIDDISPDMCPAISSMSDFAASLTSALHALCPSRRLMLIYDANDISHKGDVNVLIKACRSGCHVVISGHDDSVLRLWSTEDCYSGPKTARPLPSLKLALLQPERHCLAVSGVECDPARLLGAQTCAGVRGWWLLQNSVRYLMLSTPHNRYIASGSIPPFGPALRLQTWIRLIFDSMNWESLRLNAYTLLFAETCPKTAGVSAECVRDILMLLGRVAFSQKSTGEMVSDSTFIKWLLAMPAHAGCSPHDARLVLQSLKRSGAWFSLCLVSQCNTRIRTSSE